MKGLLMAQVLFLLVVLISWGVNVYRFAECDFESPYKCEIIHAVGVIPIASVVTVWFDDDGDKE